MAVQFAAASAAAVPAFVAGPAASGAHYSAIAARQALLKGA